MLLVLMFFGHMDIHMLWRVGVGKMGHNFYLIRKKGNITTNGSISRFHTEGVAMSTALSIGSVCKPTPESKPDSQTRLLTWSKSLRER